MKTDQLMTFLEKGGNIFLVLDSSVSSFMRYFSGQCGVEIAEQNSFVIDHSHFVEGDTDHTVIYSDEVLDNKIIFSKYKKNSKLTFSGIGMKVKQNNYLNVPLLKAESTAYTGLPSHQIIDEPFASGSNILLATAIQGENNGRVTFISSIEMLLNRYTENNLNFLLDISLWGFKQCGILRARDIIHHKADGSQAEIQLKIPEQPDLPETMYPAPEIAPNSLFYRIKDDIIYSVVIEEYLNSKWVPYKANDVQLEFVMLNPYIRTTLECNNGNFSSAFKIPDAYGIYKFHVNYRRTGYTRLSFDTEVMNYLL